MRRNERSGPVIMNYDEAATGPSSGEEDAAVSDVFETASSAKSPALADKQPLQKTEATTRMEKQRGNFTAGFLLEPARSHATRITSRKAVIVIPPRNRIVPRSWACDSWPLIPNSNVGQNNLSFSIIQAISSVPWSVSCPTLIILGEAAVCHSLALSVLAGTGISCAMRGQSLVGWYPLHRVV